MVWQLTPRPGEEFRVPAARLGPPSLIRGGAGRNDPCPCGSGRKYKRCCQEVDRLLSRVISPQRARFLEELLPSRVPQMFFASLKPEELSRAVREVPPELVDPLAVELIDRERWGLVLRLLRPLLGDDPAAAVRSRPIEWIGHLIVGFAGAGYSRKATAWLEAAARRWREEERLYRAASTALEIMAHLLSRPGPGTREFAALVQRLWPDDAEIRAAGVRLLLAARDLEGAHLAARAAIQRLGPGAFDPDEDGILLDAAEDAERALCTHILHTGLPLELYSRLARWDMDAWVMVRRLRSELGEAGAMVRVEEGLRFPEEQGTFEELEEWRERAGKTPSAQDLSRLLDLVESRKPTLAILDALSECLERLGEDGTMQVLAGLQLAGALLGEEPEGVKPRIEWRWPENRPYLRLLRRGAEVLAGTDSVETALRLALRLLEHDPEDPLAGRRAAVSLAIRDGDPRTALEIADRFPEDTSAVMLYGRALALRATFRPRAATEVLDQAIVRHPWVAAMFLGVVDQSEDDSRMLADQISQSPGEAAMLVSMIPFLHEQPGALSWLRQRWVRVRADASEPLEATPGSSALELSVTMAGILVPVRRRLLLPAHATFADLHEAIQRAMGWSGERLHEFQFDDPITGRGEVIADPLATIGPCVDEYETPLSRFLGTLGDSVAYWYDLDGHWLYDVVVERIVPLDPGISYPYLLGGEGASPPEDSGGPERYGALLQGLQDPDSPAHSWAVRELGADWDPHRFHGKEGPLGPAGSAGP